MLPGEIFFTISQAGGFEFQRKHHIAESAADGLSRHSYAPTDASSLQRDKNVTHQGGMVPGGIDQLPLQSDTSSKAGSTFKKRTLSIAPGPSKAYHMTPNKRMGPSRSISRLENDDAISRT